MNVRMRAESSTPAMPMTRSRGNLVSLKIACAIASSGFATGMMMAFGQCSTSFGAMLCMMAKLSRTRSSRLMFGLARLARRDHDDVGARRRSSRRRQSRGNRIR